LNYLVFSKRVETTNSLYLIPLVFVFEVFIPYYFSLETWDGKNINFNNFVQELTTFNKKMCCFFFSPTEGVNKKAAGRMTTTNCSVAKVKIMVWDHNRDGMMERASVGDSQWFFPHDLLWSFIWAINV